MVKKKEEERNENVPKQKKLKFLFKICKFEISSKITFYQLNLSNY